MSKSRRDFLKGSVGIAAICCGVGMVGVLEGCTTARYVDFTKKDSKLLVNKLDLGTDAFVMVNFNQLEAPLYIRKVSEEKYRAFLMLCTHKGCTIKPAGAILVCPCHGSEFSSKGKVLKGPAVESLVEYPVTHDQESIYIEIG